MIRSIALALAAGIAFTGTALAAEPIVGTWKRPNGTLIRYAASGGQFCGTVLTGEYKNQSIGCMKGSGTKYTGKVNKLDEGKEYKGSATISGNTLSLQGCFAVVFCKSESLTRQ
jgi:uncharacterized protein (DUF2147 family)